MITAEQIDRQSGDERSAWLASLNEDENAIVHCAVGHRWTLVVISETKRLLSMNLPAEHRLRFLEFLDGCTDNFLTVEAISLIEPICDEGYGMLRETRKLGAGKSLDVIARWEVFNAFIALNPSLLTAIKMPRNHNNSRNA
jgi:hypothetical protein